MMDIPRCPICKREIPAADRTASFRPFCSKRCKTIDLGGWLDANYRISDAVAEEDLDASPLPKADDGDGD
jgi:endogenous inhibitor of DNA gyrase (YacG/DUF329 family)